ncbi:MAG: DivIVA domain-containing protein [Oscillospiraceae bacterium]|nr:DivIVA domain-containing protein [Oscillospiraceae bacterium]
MLTPQDISEKSFVKAVFGGYDMSGVDDFLEVISSDYSALYKENAILKGKLKVLVEKVEEYRSTEDAMRMALLTAQRMGEEITVEAARTKDEMLKTADEEVRAKLSDTSKRIADEELRLSVATKETAKFLELSQAIMKKHAEFLKKLETANRAMMPTAPSEEFPEPIEEPVVSTIITAPTPAPTPVSAPAPTPAQSEADFDVDDVAAQIGSAVEKITSGDADVSSPSETAEPAQEDPPISLFEEKEDVDDEIAIEEPEDIASGDTIKIPVVEEEVEDITPRPKFDFDDLKFGANFDSDD